MKLKELKEGLLKIKKNKLMRTTTYLSTCALIAFSIIVPNKAFSYAMSAYEDPTRFVKIQSPLPKAKATIDLLTEQIRIISKKGNVYLFPLEATDEESRKSFQELSSSEKISFQNNRMNFLRYLITTLEFSKLAVGIGSYTKNKIVILVSHLNVFSRGKEKKKSKGLRESIQLTSQVIRDIVKGTDLQLTRSAPLIANQTEVAITLVGPVILTAGADIQAKNINFTFGGHANVGFTFGFNFAKKALVFEFFTEIEKMQRAITPTSLAGFVPKINFEIKYHRKYNLAQNHAGDVHYPMGVPLTAMKSPTMISFGYNSSFTGFAVPPIISDGFSYNTSLKRLTHGRLVISPIIKYFFRLDIPAKRVFFQTVNNFLFEIKSRSKKASVGYCPLLF